MTDPRCHKRIDANFAFQIEHTNFSSTQFIMLMDYTTGIVDALMMQEPSKE